MNEEFIQLSREQAKQVCKKIKELAKECDITHEAIATKVGLDRTAVTRLLSGRYSPRLDIVLSVLAALSELTGQVFTLKDVDVVESKTD